MLARFLHAISASLALMSSLDMLVSTFPPVQRVEEMGRGKGIRRMTWVTQIVTPLADTVSE